MARGWLVACAAAAVLAVAVADAQRSGPDVAAAEQAVLASAAADTLIARANALVQGAEPSVRTPLAGGKVIRSAQFVATETAALRSLAARREQLSSAGEVFLAAQVDVRVNWIRPAGDRLRLALTEHGTLYRSRAGDNAWSDGPESTGYAAGRVFEFVRDGGRWTLAAVELTDRGVPPITEPGSAASGRDSLPLTPMGGVARID